MEKRIKGKYIYLVLVCLTLFLYSLTEHADKLSSYIIHDKLYMSNQAYLYNIEKRTVANFVRLSAINSTLSTMKSSTIGISFIIETNLTIGKELEHLESLYFKANFHKYINI